MYSQRMGGPRGAFSQFHWPARFDSSHPGHCPLPHEFPENGRNGPGRDTVYVQSLRHRISVDLVDRLFDIQAGDAERVIPLVRLEHQGPKVLRDIHGLRALDKSKLHGKLGSHGAGNRSPQQPVVQLQQGATQTQRTPISKLFEFLAWLGDGLE